MFANFFSSQPKSFCSFTAKYSPGEKQEESDRHNLRQWTRTSRGDPVMDTRRERTAQRERRTDTLGLRADRSIQRGRERATERRLELLQSGQEGAVNCFSCWQVFLSVRGFRTRRRHDQHTTSSSHAHTGESGCFLRGRLRRDREQSPCALSFSSSSRDHPEW